MLTIRQSDSARHVNQMKQNEHLQIFTGKVLNKAVFFFPFFPLFSGTFIRLINISQFQLKGEFVCVFSYQMSTVAWKYKTQPKRESKREKGVVFFIFCFILIND